MPSSPPSPSQSATTDRRPGPFSLIEFGNLVSAALALDNDPANRFSESLLQFDPDLNVAPSSSRADASAHAKTPDDDEVGSREFEIKPTTSLRSPHPSESPPPLSLMIQESESTQENAQNMKHKLNTNWVSPTRTRKLLNKIKRKAVHILRRPSASTSVPVLDTKVVQPAPGLEPDPGPNTEPEPELEYGPELVGKEESSPPPIATPIPTVDLPSSFYKGRGESIAKDQVFVPFLPLVVQYERERNKSTPKHFSSPDGMSIFSRPSSRVTRPTETGSRPASAVVSGPPATLDPAADYHRFTDESDASTRRWSVHTSDYDPSVPSCYSSKTDESHLIVGGSSLGFKPSQGLSLPGSRDTHTCSAGGYDLPSTSTYVAAGSSTHQQHPDWTLSLPLDAPLDVIYPPSASSSTRSDSPYLSGSYTYASSAASALSKGKAKGKERAYHPRLSEAVLQHQDPFPHHPTTSSTLTTVGTGSPSCSSWVSPTPCPGKPLPPMPAPIGSRASEEERRSGSGSGIEGNLGSGKEEVRRGSLEDRRGTSSPEPSPTSTFAVIQPEVGSSDAQTNAEGDEVGTPEDDVVILKSAMREGSRRGDQESTTGTLYYQCREVDNAEYLA